MQVIIIAFSLTFPQRQLTKLPSSSSDDTHYSLDSPSSAAYYETRLRDGDIVVVYVGPSITDLDVRSNTGRRPTGCRTMYFQMRSPRSVYLLVGQAV